MLPAASGCYHYHRHHHRHSRSSNASGNRRSIQVVSSAPALTPQCRLDKTGSWMLAELTSSSGTDSYKIRSSTLCSVPSHSNSLRFYAFLWTLIQYNEENKKKKEKRKMRPGSETTDYLLYINSLIFQRASFHLVFYFAKGGKRNADYYFSSNFVSTLYLLILLLWFVGNSSIIFYSYIFFCVISFSIHLCIEE